MPHHIFDHNRGWRRICAILAAALLFCAPVLAAAGKSAADYYVKEMPGAPDGPLLKMHAGHIEVTPESHGNLFFWHFQNRHIGDKQRTVIWLNGGPGCSSLDGALMEIGPYRVGEGGKLSYNNGSWDEFANLLFIDQPVGTGYSYVDTNAFVHELDEMADNILKFLTNFMDLFPEYANDDIYIAGESFAGQFIPYIARAILKHNAELPGRTQFNLKGLLIGNGWIAPKEQYESYTKFAYQMGVLHPETAAATAVETQLALCTAELNAGNNHINIDPCEQVLMAILDQTQNTHGHEANDVCVNMYDVRLRDSAPSCGMNWPPDLKDITPYTRRDDVKRALHVDAQKQIAWTECNGAVGSALRTNDATASIDLLPDLIKEVPVVLFSGDQDMICNHLGTEALIHNMEWNGGKGFELPNAPGTWAPRQDWTFEGEPAGFYQEARNLTYVLFYNASHMVPFDYPRRTRDMLDRFMGVDISSIGGEPSDSRLDGEKAPSTSVGGHPNSTAAEEATKGKLKQAAVNAYYKSGEVVLILLLLGLAAWGTWYWRTKRRSAGYLGLGRGGGGGGDYGDGSASRMLKRMSHAVLQSPAGATSFRDRIPSMHERGPRLEAADFDENELADLTSPRAGGPESDDEGEAHRLNGGGFKAL